MHAARHPAPGTMHPALARAPCTRIGLLFRAMAIRIELSCRLPNSPGALGGVCRLLSNERINIIAMTLESGGQLRLVVDNHVHGGAVLREHHHQVVERDVIVTSLPN